jgi:ribosome-associated translation inhibitor RaiA
MMSVTPFLDQLIFYEHNGVKIHIPVRHVEMVRFDSKKCIMTIRLLSGKEICLQNENDDFYISIISKLKKYT